jgi:hypothetical protein
MVASKVGLPLEVDMENLHKSDYVRVKIGCRDVTKVPASVDGLLDFNFYDYFFQREVPQDGYTNPAGNTWIRNDKNKPQDDFPDPKRQKMDPSDNSVQTFEAGASRSSGIGKGKQVAGNEVHTKEIPQQESVDEDSEDEALLMGDLVQPGSEQLRFGSFDNIEIRMLSTIIVNEDAHAVINEYGSNLKKSKFDPLKTIEAKKALHDCGKMKIFQLEDYMIGTSSSKKLPTIQEEKKGENVPERAVSMSPVKDSQGAPEVDLSSQEEALQKVSQDIDWDIIQEEDDLEAEVTMMAVEIDTDSDKRDAVVVIATETLGMESQIIEQEGGVTLNEQDCGTDKIQETVNAWEQQDNSPTHVVEKEQSINQDGWPVWQQVRQSKRLRESGTAQAKMVEQGQGNNSTAMEVEGMESNDQNSFAVLSNFQIISLATQMGIHT